MNAARIEPRAGRTRRAFTLIEMLVVVVIIGILAGLVSAAAVMARRTARKAEIRTEISGLEQGLETFKNKYGRYPPDGSNEADVQAFIIQAWPNYSGANDGSWKTATGWTNWQNDPAAALVFWLGGMRNGKELLGFGPNWRNPFETTSTSGRQGPFFDFRPDRLGFDNNKLYYYQPNATGDTEPYVYFKARANKQFASSWNNCKPCYDTRAGTNVYAKNTSFQIRAPGFDGKHGSGQQFPAGTDYNDVQFDDMSNFATGTFEDELP